MSKIDKWIIQNCQNYHCLYRNDDKHCCGWYHNKPLENVAYYHLHLEEPKCLELINIGEE